MLARGAYGSGGGSGLRVINIFPALKDGDFQGPVGPIK